MAITDRKSAEAWLEGKPREVRVTFAARCALRALPGIATAERATVGDIALPVLRATLTSGVAAVALTPEVSEAAYSADSAAYSAALTADSADSAALSALSASSAARSADSAALSASSAARSADSAALTADSAAAAFSAAARSAAVSAAWSAADADATRLDSDTPEFLFRQPLWPSSTTVALSAEGRVMTDSSGRVLLARTATGLPVGLSDALTELRDFWGESPDTWSFWARWYAGMLEKGAPMDWDLQREVALIPDADWDKGPAHIARKIERIEARFLLRKAPLAEQVEINPDTGKFRTVPIPVENAALIGAMITRTNDTIEDALLGRNGLREDSSEVRKLRRTQSRYANDPQQIELNYTSVAISLRRQINETGELAKSEDNFALLEAVEEGALAIRAHHPEVATNRATIAQQKLRELGADGVELLEDAAPVLAALSEDVMQEDFKRDIPKLINDATLPLPSGAPPLPGVDESMRIFSRISKMRLLYEEWTDEGAKAFDSKQFKTVRLGLTVGGILAALVRLGLWLFGVL